MIALIFNNVPTFTTS